MMNEIVFVFFLYFGYFTECKYLDILIIRQCRSTYNCDKSFYIIVSRSGS